MMTDRVTTFVGLMHTAAAERAEQWRVRKQLDGPISGIRRLRVGSVVVEEDVQRDLAEWLDRVDPREAGTHRSQPGSNDRGSERS